MSDKKEYTDGDEWLKAFKEKMKVSLPDKFKGKVTHQQTSFRFEVNGEDYSVYCPAAKSGSNVFRVYKDGVKIYVHNPSGNHVNKTTAEYALRLGIAHFNKINREDHE